MNKKITIEGMSCGNCVRHVEEALSNLDGVKSVKVNLKKNLASLKLTEQVSDELLTQTIDELGYTVTSIKE